MTKAYTGFEGGSILEMFKFLLALERSVREYGGKEILNQSRHAGHKMVLLKK